MTIHVKALAKYQYPKNAATRDVLERLILASLERLTERYGVPEMLDAPGRGGWHQAIVRELYPDVLPDLKSENVISAPLPWETLAVAFAYLEGRGALPSWCSLTVTNEQAPQQSYGVNQQGWDAGIALLREITDRDLPGPGGEN